MKKIVIFIIFLILIILGLGGYIAYDKIYLEIKGKKVVTQLGEKEIDLNVFSNINETLYKLDQAFNDSNSNYFGYIYYNKKLNVKKFDEKAAVYLSMYDYINNYRGENTIDSKVIESEFKKIFGKNLTYKKADIKVREETYITYDSNTDTYSYNNDVDKELYSPTYITQNISTTIEEEGIVVKRKVFYVEYEKNETSIIAHIYESKEKKKLIAKMPLKNGILNIKEVIGKYGYKINEYKYIFEEKSYDEYYLTEIIQEK